MNMFDEARSLFCMAKMRKMTQRQIAESLGLTQSYISNKLRLLRLDEKTQKRISDAGLSERHARALLRLTDEGERLELLDRICSEGLSVKRTEALVDLLYSKKAPERIGRAERIKASDEFIESVERSVNTLSSLGVSAEKSVKYYDKKIYLTVVISED